MLLGLALVLSDNPAVRLDFLVLALASAKAIGDPGARAWALAAVAPHLAPEQVGEALAAAKAIGDEYFRAQALAALAPPARAGAGGRGARRRQGDRQ